MGTQPQASRVGAAAGMCYVHLQVAAVGTCRACRRPSCKKCLTDDELCKNCYEPVKNARIKAYLLEVTAPGVVVYALAESVDILGLLYLPFLGYFLLKDGLGEGQSLAKRIFRIRVIRRDGQPCGFGRSILRNLILVIPLFALVDALMVFKGRRIGDLLGGTLVVPA